MKYAVIGLAVLTCVFAASVICTAGPAPKATGGGSFMRTEDGVEIEARFNFEAHGEQGNQPAKGWFKYHDEMGNKFTAEVTCVQVSGNDAYFSGPIVDYNMDEWEGMWLFVWVEDGGSPGDGNDTIGGEMYDFDPGCSPNLWPEEYWAVSNGNIVVH